MYNFKNPFINDWVNLTRGQFFIKYWRIWAIFCSIALILGFIDVALDIRNEKLIRQHIQKNKEAWRDETKSR